MLQIGDATLVSEEAVHSLVERGGEIATQVEDIWAKSPKLMASKGAD